MKLKLCLLLVYPLLGSQLPKIELERQSIAQLEQLIQTKNIAPETRFESQWPAWQTALHQRFDELEEELLDELNETDKEIYRAFDFQSIKKDELKQFLHQRSMLIHQGISFESIAKPLSNEQKQAFIHQGIEPKYLEKTLIVDSENKYIQRILNNKRPMQPFGGLYTHESDTILIDKANVSHVVGASTLQHEIGHAKMPEKYWRLRYFSHINTLNKHQIELLVELYAQIHALIHAPINSSMSEINCRVGTKTTLTHPAYNAFATQVLTKLINKEQPTAIPYEWYKPNGVIADFAIQKRAQQIINEKDAQIHELTQKTEALQNALQQTSFKYKLDMLHQKALKKLDKKGSWLTK